MNKFLIILLAVCLVSVHAFVKRDAPLEKPLDFDTIQKHLEESFQVAVNKIKSFEGKIDMELLQKQGNELIDGVKASLDKLTVNVVSTTPSPK